MLQFKSFKTRIFLIMIVISLIPLIIISLINLWLVLETRQKNIAELQNLAISNASVETKKFLNQKIESLNVVVSGSATADNMAITSISNINGNNLIVLIKQVADTIKDAREVSFIDRGIVAARIDGQGDVFINKYYVTSEILHQNVEIIESIDASQADSELYRTAMNGQNYFGPVEYVDGSPIERMASQIENQDKEIIGVITATIDLNPIKNIIDRIKLGQSGFVYLVDSGGRLIISSNEKFAIPGEKLIEPKMVADVIAGNTHDGLVKFETFKNTLGQTMVFAGRPMGMINWFVMSEWPKNDAFSVISSIIWQSLAIMTSSLLLVVFLSWLLSGQVIKPIKTLGQAAKEISTGNLDYQVELKANDEFDILGKKFNQMVKVLKENKELRDEFVFVAAHELRTPVTAIKGYVSMMLDGTLGKAPDKLSESLKVVMSVNERLVQLVQDLLEIARSESGKMVIEVKPLELNEAVKLVATELKALAEPKGLKINYEEPKSKLAVMADDYKLKEVLTNLIGNAIKYTLKASQIDISHDISGNEVITHIKDQGLGMSAEAQKKLFSKFYRVKTDQTAKIEGTGLGLFICKEIVERMGGRIWVKSKEGEGSTFSFALKKG